MKFQILTLFPEAFESFLSTSIIGRAISDKKIEVELFNIRDFTENKHKKVDDVPFGGGAGMLMMCQPLFSAIEHVKGLSNDSAPVIYFSPQGDIWDQKLAEKFADQMNVIPSRSALGTKENSLLAKARNIFSSKIPGKSRVILLCGHYEGIDQRVIDTLVDQQICLGKYIITGGELAAQIFIDSVGRLLPEVIGKEASHQEESFSDILEGKIEYPHYTRPAEFRGMKVPDVLLSGHHAEIEKWRKENCK